ncbi:Mlc2p [Scheffersomyces stipitis CBS 6054]|uniref:Mlc2p n=1 Tax=Scheffersomyces stipitis (strain ATCC 58785 / CBS 6054 / NBRC 10063 / NRRL Y-11545) TaxID=322104 RepID=A3LVF7_PICST|nr:Mlc2p [Scheffersomyces stipitis CBS 6054]ABN67112.2 Mlc2p [Scheffersomyces stipitis CBS 6054]KAG2734676.1 hypothetical protein G9P44_002682 [Scheffersomyces stipitis]
MSALNTLTGGQKAQLRNAFTLIDGESRDSLITKLDLVKLYTTLGLKIPTDEELASMLSLASDNSEQGKEPGLNFTQFSNIMAKELSKLEDRTTIYKALKVFENEKAVGDNRYDDIEIELEKIKDACCTVQLGEIGSGDHRLSRSKFDEMVAGFVKGQMDGRQIFQASKWIEAYID